MDSSDSQSDPEPTFTAHSKFIDFKEIQSESWVGKTNAEKQFVTWKVLCADETEESWYSLASSLATFDLSPTFDLKGDQMPDDRHKTLHSAGGVVAEVSFVPAQGTGYTGIFQGAEFGIIRLSWMTQPAYDGHNIPGFAIKFFRTGIHSGNIFGLNEGVEDNNFLSSDFSNHADVSSVGVGLSLLTQKFKNYSSYSEKTGLSDFAKFDENGFLEENPNFPFEIQYRVPSVVRNAMDETDIFEEGLCKAFERSCQVGTTLFQLFGRSHPGAALQPIGRLVLTSPFTTSAFGDQKLFFQHTLFETDLKYRPSWEFVLTTTDAEYCEYLRAGEFEHVKLLCNLCPRFVNERISLSYIYAFSFGYRGLTGNPYAYPLHVAAKEGHVEIVKFLLQAKADVSLQDNSGKTALEMVSSEGEIFDLLNIASEQNSSPQGSEIECPDILFKALDSGNKHLVVEYIKEHPELVNAKCKLKRSYAFWYGTVRYGEYYTYPLHIAVYKENRDLIILLLKAGADPRYIDGWGRTPIDLNPEIFLNLKGKRCLEKRTSSTKDITVKKQDACEMPEN